jgi:membrane protease YdiL (CAAX protease family)
MESGLGDRAVSRGQSMKKPVALYFLLVFLVAWGAVMLVVGPEGLRGTAQPETGDLLPVFGAMLLGPAAAGVLLTYLTGGRKGLSELWSRQKRWRVGGRWYAIALLTTPALLLTILVPLSTVSVAFVPAVIASGNVAEVVAFGLASGLLAGFLEEVGWTGFAQPALRRRHSVLLAGLILGLIWGAWHGLADYWGAHATFGSLWFPRILLWTLALTAYRMLMARVYEHTGSLLVSQLMHASFTGSQGILVPSLSPAAHFTWYGLFTMALWLMVAVLFVRTRRRNPETA